MGEGKRIDMNVKAQPRTDKAFAPFPEYHLTGSELRRAKGASAVDPPERVVITVVLPEIDGIGGRPVSLLVAAIDRGSLN